MDEVAAMSVGAKTFVEETKTRFRFVGSVLHTVAPQLLRSMRELAPFSVGAGPSHHEVLAEGALDFGCFE